MSKNFVNVRQVVSILVNLPVPESLVSVTRSSKYLVIKLPSLPNIVIIYSIDSLEGIVIIKLYLQDNGGSVSGFNDEDSAQYGHVPK